MATKPISKSALLVRFENLGSIFPDEVVVQTEGGSRFHLPDIEAEEPTAACTARDTEYTTIDTEKALNSGFVPCVKCFSRVAEYMAANPKSEVELSNGDNPQVLTTKAPVEANGELQTQLPDTRKLTSLPQQVKINSSTKIMHAPAPSGTVCGRRGGYRTVDLEAVEGHFEPCQDCFHVDSL